MWWTSRDALRQQNHGQCLCSCTLLPKQVYINFMTKRRSSKCVSINFEMTSKGCILIWLFLLRELVWRVLCLLQQKLTFQYKSKSRIHISQLETKKLIYIILGTANALRRHCKNKSISAAYRKTNGFTCWRSYKSLLDKTTRYICYEMRHLYLPLCLKRPKIPH